MIDASIHLVIMREEKSVMFGAFVLHMWERGRDCDDGRDSDDGRDCGDGVAAGTTDVPATVVSRAARGLL